MIKNVVIVAAIGRRGQLGLGGKLPWHDPDDLREFYNTVDKGFSIAGKNTSRQVRKLLGSRRLIEQSRSMSCQDVVDACLAMNPALTLYVCGGADVYAAWLRSGLVRETRLTHIDYDGPADRWFPFHLMGSL